MDEAVGSADLVIVGHNYRGIETVRANDATYHLLDLTGQIQLSHVRRLRVVGVRVT